MNSSKPGAGIADFKFARHIMQTVVGGMSSVDIPRLHLKTIEQAHEFIKTYGYDLRVQKNLDEVWGLHRLAVTILRDRLLNSGEEIPSELTDPHSIKDPGNLLLMASDKTSVHQGWACSILRVMHVLAHLEDDFFKVFSEQIRDTIFRPIQAHLSADPVSGVTLGHRTDRDQIRLQKFDIKHMKSLASSAIKLLSKPEATALSVYDKVGVRFVTKGVYDAFRVVRFLVDEHIISFPNVMPDQARNNLYPVNLFLEVMEDVRNEPSTNPDEIESLLQKKLQESLDRAEYIERKNDFSGSNFRAIKFIARRLIEVESGGNKFHFFFPYEIQIMDYETYLKNISGPEAHELYKQRQREAVRRRVLVHLYQESQKS